jgi:hypothetical protein
MDCSCSVCGRVQQYPPPEGSSPLRFCLRPAAGSTAHNGSVPQSVRQCGHCCPCMRCSAARCLGRFRAAEAAVTSGDVAAVAARRSVVVAAAAAAAAERAKAAAEDYRRLWMQRRLLATAAAAAADIREAVAAAAAAAIARPYGEEDASVAVPLDAGADEDADSDCGWSSGGPNPALQAAVAK